MRILAIVQARMTSTRLPGKVLLQLGKKTVIQNIYERLSKSTKLNDVVIATSIDPSDDAIEKDCTTNGISTFRGSLDNVLERFFLCASYYRADIIVRCTADNPFVDAEIVDAAITLFNQEQLDYLSFKKRLPLGMAVEVFSYSALKKAYEEATNSECLEHVTPYIINNVHMFKVCRFEDPNDKDYSSYRFTMDTPEDYRFVSVVYNYFGNNLFTFPELIETVNNHPEWRDINKTIEQKKVKYSGENRKG